MQFCIAFPSFFKYVFAEAGALSDVLIYCIILYFYIIILEYIKRMCREILRQQHSLSELSELSEPSKIGFFYSFPWVKNSGISHTYSPQHRTLYAVVKNHTFRNFPCRR